MVTTFAAYCGASKGRANWAKEACDRHRRAATARSRDNFALRSPNVPNMNKPVLNDPQAGWRKLSLTRKYGLAIAIPSGNKHVDSTGISSFARKMPMKQYTMDSLHG
jgi:hypothetical protein